jgi:hypothetical protein
MRFTIGSRALTRASAYNPTTMVVITAYNPNVFDAFDRSAPLQISRFDGQTFSVTASMRNGELAIDQHRAVWVRQSQVTVLPDLCDQPEYTPQPPIDLWEVGNVARAEAELAMATQSSYFAGGRV